MQRLVNKVRNSQVIPAKLKILLRCIYQTFFKSDPNIKYQYLLKANRFESMTLNFEGKPLKIADGPSFYSMHSEIWVNEIYKLKNMPSKPYFLDCGANIGMATIYLKKMHPMAKVVCFEPDTKIFEILKRNINQYQELTDVTLINKGVWENDGRLEFISEGADGGRLKIDNDKENLVIIEVTTLSKYIDRTVDFLKIDIEGAEYEVLNEIQKSLHQVRNIFLEYHSFKGQKQKLPEILQILKNLVLGLILSVFLDMTECLYLTLTKALEWIFS